MRQFAIALACGALASLAFAGIALTEDSKDWGAFQVGDKRSGYTYAQPETQAIQDDDFENPAFLLVDLAAELWEKTEGEAGKACTSCHEDAVERPDGLRGLDLPGCTTSPGAS